MRSKSVCQNGLRAAIRTAHVPPEAGAGGSDSGSKKQVGTKESWKAKQIGEGGDPQAGSGALARSAGRVPRDSKSYG